MTMTNSEQAKTSDTAIGLSSLEAKALLAAIKRSGKGKSVEVVAKEESLLLRSTLPGRREGVRIEEVFARGREGGEERRFVYRREQLKRLAAAAVDLSEVMRLRADAIFVAGDEHGALESVGLERDWEGPRGRSFKCSAADLSRALRVAAFSRDEARTNLRQVRLEDGLAVSTDGHRMQATPVAMNGDHEPLSLTAGVCKILQSAISKTGRLRADCPTCGAKRRTPLHPDVFFESDSKGFSITTGDGMITGLHAGFTFPPWRSLLGVSEAATVACVNVAELRHAVSVALLSCGRVKGVRFSFDGKSVVVTPRKSGKDLTSRARSVDCTSETGTRNCSVVLNGAYVLKALSNMGETTSISAGPEDLDIVRFLHEKATSVVMPIRT